MEDQHSQMARSRFLTVEGPSRSIVYGPLTAEGSSRTIVYGPYLHSCSTPQCLHCSLGSFLARNVVAAMVHPPEESVRLKSSMLVGWEVDETENKSVGDGTQLFHNVQKVLI